MKCVSEPSTKALQDAVIHASVGAEVIPQGPPEGDHMANGRVEMAVREVKRQCTAEQNTSVRIEDDSPFLSWLPRFAAQVMNKMRIGKDGKTSEIRRTGRRWRKPMAQLGEKVWFRKIGEDGVSSFAKSHDSTNLCWPSRQNSGSFVHSSEWSCARQKLDKTDTGRCLGIDELGRLVWHSVANGGSGIEVDEEGRS